jgi:hypothetical protein
MKTRSLSLTSLQAANDPSHSHALAVQQHKIDKRRQIEHGACLLTNYQNLTLSSTQALRGGPGAKNVELWEGTFPACGPLV